MTLDEALGWLKGERSTTNMVPPEPRETWIIRISQADAAWTEQSYWMARAHKEGLLNQPKETQNE